MKSIVNKLHKIEPNPKKVNDNLSKEERKAYNELRSLSKDMIEIKKADKSDTWVIIDKAEYKDLILKEHLLTNTYETAPVDSNEKVFVKLKNLIEKYKHCLNKDEVRHIIDNDWKDAYFYGLPKIHKCKEITDKIKVEHTDYIKMELPKSLKTRPICGAPQGVTQGASRLLSRILTPLVCEMKSYIQDEWSFVRRFPNKVSSKVKLLSCDIVSLYSSIPTELGLEALEYWIDMLRHKIAPRFSKQFILELAKFVLSNNYCLFGTEMFRQVIGTAMGAIFAPPYACLTIGYLEETKLYPTLLPSKFDAETCLSIIEYFFRFMDDGTTLFPANVNEEEFKILLNSMHPAIKYTIDKAEIVKDGGKEVQRLVFLSLILNLDDEGNIWTNVHYKDTNTHEYLNYESNHPNHVKNNIPYTLAKRIIVFTTRDEEVVKNLQDLGIWLKECGYPNNIVRKGIRDAFLQGPAMDNTGEKVIPLVSKFVSNYDNETVLHIARTLLKETIDERLIAAFKDTKIIHAYSQPPNLLRSLTSSKFITGNENQKTGIFRCSDKRCKICKIYLQTGDSVIMADGSTWYIKCYGTCNSTNTVYFQICNFCKEESNIGKTDKFRGRTNTHISGCRTGRTTDLFDLHVFKCATEKGIDLTFPSSEPFFTLHILMVCRSYNKLLSYESMLQARGLDTINKP